LELLKKQRDLIETITSENKLDPNELNKLADERFGVTVRELNKLQASGLIDELLEKYGNREQNGQLGRFRSRGKTRQETGT
jgi:predicted transcriptional regulator